MTNVFLDLPDTPLTRASLLSTICSSAALQMGMFLEAFPDEAPALGQVHDLLRQLSTYADERHSAALREGVLDALTGLAAQAGDVWNETLKGIDDGTAG